MTVIEFFNSIGLGFNQIVLFVISSFEVATFQKSFFNAKIDVGLGAVCLWILTANILYYYWEKIVERINEPKEIKQKRILAKKLRLQEEEDIRERQYQEEKERIKSLRGIKKIFHYSTLIIFILLVSMPLFGMFIIFVLEPLLN